MILPSQDSRSRKSRLNNDFVWHDQKYGRHGQDIRHLWEMIVLLVIVLFVLSGCQGNVEPMQKPTPVVASQAELPLQFPSALQAEAVSKSVSQEIAPPPEVPSVKPSAELVARGGSLYQEYCKRCHGAAGEGNGELAADLNPRPANLAAGVYKFRSTASGTLPTDADLLRILLVGVPGTAMSDFRDLSVFQRQALVSYIKTLSSRFNDESLPSPVQFPENRAATDQALDRGKQVYADMQCAACHGEQGKGDGELADALSDSSGVPIRPANLTKQPLKSGTRPEDIYRTVMTGLDGTPMPSYGDSLSLDQGRDLALYVFSFSQRRGEE